MASQVLSGSGSVSYTNNTGQNVRIVINYMSGTSTSGSGTIINPGIVITWGAVNAPLTAQLTGTGFSAIGRNLAFNTNVTGVGNNGLLPSGNALPTELMLAPGQIFNAACTLYNIVIIPEAG
jgi:hypothetical protein